MSGTQKIIPLNALKVKRIEGEKARKFLIKENLLLKDFQIAKDEEFLYFPLKDDYYKYASIKWEITRKEFFQKQLIEPIQLQLEDLLPIELHDRIPSSYDRVDDVLLIKLPFEMLDYKEKIGEIFRENLKVRSVFMKIGVTSSIYRITKWDCISGENNPNVIHKMNNLRFSTNINEAYFNPRLAVEYKRISALCQDNWTIIDMFAGIGPFCLTVAAEKKVIIYACDINPKAILHFQKNMELNRNLKGRILIFQGDISEIIMKNSFPKANLIFMNLPEDAIEYLELAMMYLKFTGLIILHQFIRVKDKSKSDEIEVQKKQIEEKVFYYNKINKLNLNSFKVEFRVLREVSPSKSHIVWEIQSLT